MVTMTKRHFLKKKCLQTKQFLHAICYVKTVSFNSKFLFFMLAFFCNMILVFLENTMSPLSNRKVINEVINESNQKLYF